MPRSVGERMMGLPGVVLCAKEKFAMVLNVAGDVLWR